MPGFFARFPGTFVIRINRKTQAAFSPPQTNLSLPSFRLSKRFSSAFRQKLSQSGTRQVVGWKMEGADWKNGVNENPSVSSLAPKWVEIMRRGKKTELLKATAKKIQINSKLMKCRGATEGGGTGGLHEKWIKLRPRISQPEKRCTEQELENVSSQCPLTLHVPTPTALKKSS